MSEQPLTMVERIEARQVEAYEKRKMAMESLFNLAIYDRDATSGLAIQILCAQLIADGRGDLVNLFHDVRTSI